jgi:hypothetical protein
MRLTHNLSHGWNSAFLLAKGCTSYAASFAGTNCGSHLMTGSRGWREPIVPDDRQPGVAGTDRAQQQAAGGGRNQSCLTTGWQELIMPNDRQPGVAETDPA